MIIKPVTNLWAFAEDIPGSRCSPEVDQWPKPYRVLEEGDIWKELKYMAKPQSKPLDLDAGKRADSINFQPSPKTRTQDRYVVRQLKLPNGEEWTLTGVFDGHLGETTVDHVSHHLPIIVHECLLEAFKSSPQSLKDRDHISGIFSRAIIQFDSAIAGDVLDLFGGSLETLKDYSDAQIRNILHSNPENYQKARLNMYGTTALVALVDPTYSNLWVANLGDCQAVLVTPSGETEWHVQALTSEHNGNNESEIQRVQEEHPGEEEAVMENRVLGALAPFRSLGDTPFKQPQEFTRRILFNLQPGLNDTSPWEEFLKRNRTPPYISAEPEIHYCRLPSHAQSVRQQVEPLTTSDGKRKPMYLILHSDGFSDLCEERQIAVIEEWARNLPDELTPPTSAPSSPPENLALRLLHQALGGEDRTSVSRVLTLDMDAAWIDDTSIIVQTL